MGLADVQLHGDVALKGHVQLEVEHILLHVPRRQVVVVVQADLAQQAALGVVQIAAHSDLGIRVPAGGVVGMHADGPVEKIAAGHDAKHLLLVAHGHQPAALVLGAVVDRLARVGHHQCPGHARVQKARDHLVLVRVEARVRNVAVGVK